MKKEFLLNFIFTLLTSILGFAQNKFFVQYMGIETLGMMKLFSQLLAYLNIVELGLGSASAFALYKPLAEKDYKKISIVVTTIESIYNKIAIIILGLGILCIPLIPFFMEVSDFSNKIYFYWILYVLNTVSTYLFIKYVILFTANQEFIFVRFIQSSSKILFQFLQILFIIQFHSFFLYIILLICDNLLQYIFFRKHYKSNYSYIEKTVERYEGIKTDIKNLFWHKIGSLVVFNTDLILISKFVSLSVVGIYASYQMVTQIVGTIIGVGVGVISPKIGKYIAEHKKNEVYFLFKKSNILFLLIALFFSYCVFILINHFISLWMGEEFLLSKLTQGLIVTNLFISIFRWNLEIYKGSAGFFDDIRSPMYESIINLVVSIILGLKIELDGIIIGTIASNIIVILIYKPILVFERCFDKDWKEYIKVYGNYIFLTVISLFCLKFIVNPFLRTEISSWFGWIIYATIISAVSIIVLSLVFLLNKDYRNIIKTYILKKK